MSAIEYARELLARCESGETIAVTAVEERAGGAYVVLGSSVAPSRRADSGDASGRSDDAAQGGLNPLWRDCLI